VKRPSWTSYMRRTRGKGERAAYPTGRRGIQPQVIGPPEVRFACDATVPLPVVIYVLW
jgi:hypothetical protein